MTEPTTAEERKKWAEIASNIILSTPVKLIGTDMEPEDYAGALFLSKILAEWDGMDASLEAEFG